VGGWGRGGGGVWGGWWVWRVVAPRSIHLIGLFQRRRVWELRGGAFLAEGPGVRCKAHRSLRAVFRRPWRVEGRLASPAADSIRAQERKRQRAAHAAEVHGVGGLETLTSRPEMRRGLAGAVLVSGIAK